MKPGRKKQGYALAAVTVALIFVAAVSGAVLEAARSSMNRQTHSAEALQRRYTVIGMAEKTAAALQRYTRWPPSQEDLEQLAEAMGADHSNGCAIRFEAPDMPDMEDDAVVYCDIPGTIGLDGAFSEAYPVHFRVTVGISAAAVPEEPEGAEDTATEEASVELPREAETGEEPAERTCHAMEVDYIIEF